MWHDSDDENVLQRTSMQIQFFQIMDFIVGYDSLRNALVPLVLFI